jgi:DNA-directed RNA polymerase specialized sigma24 family protein
MLTRELKYQRRFIPTAAEDFPVCAIDGLEGKISNDLLFRKVMRVAAAALSEEHRMVLFGYYLEQWRIADIAAARLCSVKEATRRRDEALRIVRLFFPPVPAGGRGAFVCEN